MDCIKPNLENRNLLEIWSVIVTISGLWVSSLLTAPAHAQSDFYRTKPLTLVVGYAVGGGYDVYARLLARHLPRHIPGNPTIIVQNMPGAGSLTALRHQDAIAPKDGSVVTLFDFFQIIN